MLNLSQFRKIPDRLTDVLPWAALVAQDTVLNKDGAFQSTFKYRGPDLESSTDEELTVKAAQINNILRRLGSGWALYAEAQRKAVDPYPQASFPDALSELIDFERKIIFDETPHFETHYYLTLVYLPPGENLNRLSKAFLSSDNGSEVNYEKVLEQFRTQITQYLGLFERLFPEIEMLTEDALLTYLHSTISTKHMTVAMPETPMYLDALLADSPLLGGFYPKLGDEHVAVLGLMGFPGYSQPGLLDSLNHLPIEYRWVSRFIFMDKLEAKKELETYQRKWFAKRKGVTTIIRELLVKEESALSDTEALQKAEDAQAALGELGTDEVTFGYLTTTFVLMDAAQEALRAKVHETERVINGLGFVTKRETVNAVDAWLGSIPGNTRNNVRRPIVNTLNLAHLLPGISATWSGQASNTHLKGPPLLITETNGSTPFRMDLHVGDVGHSLILGPTGAGKSTLLNLLEVQFLKYPGAQVYIFDKGGSASTLTAGMGGDYYDLGDEKNNLYFQPLGLIDSEADCTWAHEWLLGIARRENVEITPEVKKALWDALAALATAPRPQRTIQTFSVFLQDLRLRAVFEPYTQTGPYGRLFDNNSDNLAVSKWQTFEMERLMHTPQIVPTVLEYLFYRLEQRFDGSPTLLVLDEAWLFLDNYSFASKIREWLKTLRKKNVAVVFATQSLSDIDTSSIADTIKEACFTKIYLPNAAALNPDATGFYNRFGLNQRQIEILAYATPRRDFYYTSRLGTRLCALNLGPLALAYCSGASPELRALTKTLQASTPDREAFNQKYLDSVGLADLIPSTWLTKEVA